MTFRPTTNSPRSQASFDLLVPLVPQSGSSKIVFASNREGVMQVYVMNADGSNVIRLTNSGANDDFPHWSPNGAKILFQSDRDHPDTGYMDIYVMNSDGSGVARLTTDANDDSFASWSPDGSKIVFQSMRNSVNYQVYSMNADGSSQTNLTNNSSSDGEPSWSPDGTKITFASDRDHAGFDSVYVMNSNGSNQHRVTFSSDTIDDTQPMWSRDGNRIAFVSTRDSTTETWQETDDDGNYITKSKVHLNKEIYLMNADGSGQLRLTNDLANDDAPSWSPDGSKIVFRSDRERDCCDPSAQVWTMNTDGSGLANISNSGNGDYSASWTSGSNNQSPVANAGGAYNGIISQNVPFAGNGSIDPDGNIVSYSWNFGDGGTASGVAPTHAYITTGTYTVTLTVTDNLGAQGSASTYVVITSSPSDQYAVNFLQKGLGRPPSGDESVYWTDIMRAAYLQGQPSMFMAMTEFGMTVFESDEYANRGRGDRDYVNDLYRTYLMRDPEYCDPNDPYCGPNYWTNQASPQHMGREQVRNAFEGSGEFHNIVATLTASGSPSSAASSLATAQVDLFNQSGNQVEARDCEFSVPLLSLPGRAGLDLGLSLSYSSLVWTRSGPYIYFDQDNESMSPGFTIGFPTVQWRKFDAQTGGNIYLFTAAGRHVELRQVGTSNLYEAADSSYLQLTESGSTLSVRSTDGTEIDFENKDTGWRAKQIEDRNGNIISITNYGSGDIQQIVDTLGRTVYFNYDGNSNLVSIKQDWAGQSQGHTWATFGWGSTPSMQLPSGAQAVGTNAGDSMPVLTQVGLPDGSRYNFDYNAAAQVNVIHRTTADNVQRAQTIYNYSAADDSTRLTNMRVSADGWTSTEALPGSYVETQFNLEGAIQTATVVGDPSGTVYKESYGTGWKKGLVAATETWGKKDPQHSVERQKWTATSWIQDDPNPNALYRTNPRVVAADVFDNSNHAHTEIGYQTFNLPYSNANCSLPNEIYEYDGQNVVRRTHTDYVPDQDYLIRHIVGLPQATFLYEGMSVLRTKTTYAYDWGGEYLQSVSGTPTQHDGSLSTDPSVRRGNIVAQQRWDVDYPNDGNKVTQNTIAYDITGNVVFMRDALGHQNIISYLDRFSDGNNSRNTFAYPTMVKDADWNATTAPNDYSTVEYNFDHGAKTRTQAPPPAGQSQGAIQTFTYDDALRLEVAAVDNGARVRYLYGSSNIVSLSSVDVVDQAYSNTTLDGLGRVIGVATNNPGSVGHYKAQWTAYDLLGRVSRQYNPTEIDGSWNPAGDDSAGRVYNEQTYDWKGRPLETTKPDGTISYASYDGCGCSGGGFITLTDEGTLVNGVTQARQQRVYADVLGRQGKTEILNWDGTVYSTRVLTYNARDQIISAKQYQGTDQSGVYQEETEDYDAYGRLKTRKAPIQATATTYTYYLNDKPETVTDARGVTTTYSYNNRGLVTGVSATGSGYDPVSMLYGYDAAANRTSMTDATGGVSYQYDQLSRLQYETRQFTGSGAPSGSYTLSYEYNPAGELKAITDPTGSRVDYGFDDTGRLTSVTGSGANSAPTYASNFVYRAWGAIKDFDLGNGVHQHLNFNSRMQNTSLALSNVASVGTMNWTYDYYADGKLSRVTDSAAPNFDRFFDYDHEGRIANALTGSEARGGTTADGPFKQTYGYDVWENTTARTGRVWAQSITNGSPNYPNNRHQDWQYDNEGNVTATYDANFAYNAAGRNNYYSANVHLPNGQSVLEIAQTFDGNGAPASKTETSRSDPNAPAAVTTTYYLRSSMLGGKVVAELDNTGYKRVGHIFAGGMEIATQNISNPGYGSQVSWTSTNPATGSEYVTDSSRNVGRHELDPLGTDVTVAPSNPLVVDEPVFYDSKFDHMPREYEGGQTEDAGVDSWYINMVNKDFDQHMADLYWQHGFRDEAQQIVANNPNVGVQSGGSTYFGRDAADFLRTVPQEPARRKAKVTEKPVPKPFFSVTVIDLDLEATPGDEEITDEPAEVLILHGYLTTSIRNLFSNNPWGHVGYLIDGHVYSWEGGDKFKQYTLEEFLRDNEYRNITGYVLNFGSGDNFKFKKLLLGAYDGQSFSDFPGIGEYRPFQNNCGEAFCRAMNKMGGHGWEPGMSPGDHESYIRSNLLPNGNVTAIHNWPNPPRRGFTWP